MTGELLTFAGSNNVFRDLGFPEAEAQNLLLRGDLALLSPGMTLAIKYLPNDTGNALRTTAPWLVS